MFLWIMTSFGTLRHVSFGTLEHCSLLTLTNQFDKCSWQSRLLLMAIKTNTHGNLDKYTWQSWQIQSTSRSSQIHIPILTNTYWNHSKCRHRNLLCVTKAKESTCWHFSCGSSLHFCFVFSSHTGRSTCVRSCDVDCSGILLITRSYAALRAADLDWIVGQGYSLGGYILEKKH